MDEKIFVTITLVGFYYQEGIINSMVNAIGVSASSYVTNFHLTAY